LIVNDLKNKTVIVAGGSGLIGSAILKGFADIGARPINADIRQGDPAYNYEYFNMHPDYISSLNKILDKYKPKGSNIDVFVNCTYPRDSITANDGMRLTTLTVANHMSLDGGSIINFGSIYGIVGSDLSFYAGTSMDMPVQYAQEKAGLIGLSRAVATRYGKFQVRCNTICPGGVWNHQPDRFVEKYIRQVPLGRMATPEDIVGPTMFYASDSSRYVTGDSMMVDGGFTAL
jgi:NAD(P)-dependent dehydrogenase (short-subunit alcohol dehydrogenase family)